MPRQGLDAARVVDAAAELADAEGLEAVTLARVAQLLGVRPPSLYKHVGGLDAVRRGVAVRGLRELGAALRDAGVGRAGEDALVALAGAYRAYAAAHPGRYAATLRAPEPGDEAWAHAAEDVLGVLLAALRAWPLEGEETVHAARAVRSALHGFVALEAAGGFGQPVDRDASFARLVGVLAGGLGAR